MQSYGFFLSKCRKKKEMLRKTARKEGGEGEERGASRYIATNRTPKRTRAEQGAKAEGTRERVEKARERKGGGGRGQETRVQAAQIKQKPSKATDVLWTAL